jgi:hypothetical protein
MCPTLAIGAVLLFGYALYIAHHDPTEKDATRLATEVVPGLRRPLLRLLITGVLKRLLGFFKKGFVLAILGSFSSMVIALCAPDSLWAQFAIKVGERVLDWLLPASGTSP